MNIYAFEYHGLIMLMLNWGVYGRPSDLVSAISAFCTSHTACLYQMGV